MDLETKTASPVRAPFLPSVGLLLLILVAALLYGSRLEEAPIHVHYDEVLLGLEAYSIAQTGRDTNGRVFPLYFQVHTNVWYQPVPIYFGAALLTLLPLSDTAIRLSTVAVALTNIALIYVVALHLFNRRSFALLSAALLTLTPAHFIHARIAVDYLHPVPFMLVWVLCLLRYGRGGRTWLLFAGTSSLGIGFYSYIASVLLMPLYLVVTWLFLCWKKDAWRAYVLALAGFTWPLLLLVPFLAAHPEILADYQARYQLVGSGTPMDPFQLLRASINSRTLTERTNIYHNFFSPGFLFVSGGSNLTNSTREAGVFLASFAVFMLAGAYDVLTRTTKEKALIAVSFLVAPMAACVVLENYAIDRALGLLPFGVLLATLGIARLWSAASSVTAARVFVACGTAIAMAGVVYIAWRLSASGSTGASAVWLIAVGGLVAAVGLWLKKTDRWHPVVALLLLLGLLQFGYFYQDYVGDYGPRSAAWFGNNLQGAIERAIELDAQRSAPVVLLSEDIRQIDAYWTFYTAVLGRGDLRPKGRTFKFDNTDVDALPIDSLLVCPADDAKAEAHVQRGTLAIAGKAVDPNDRYSPLGPGEHVTYTIYRKVTRTSSGG